MITRLFKWLGDRITCVESRNTLECGCVYTNYTFAPISVKMCDACMAKPRLPSKRSESSSAGYDCNGMPFFIADGHASDTSASCDSGGDCGGDGGGGDGGGGGE